MIRNIHKDDAESITNIYNYYVKNTVVSFEEQPIDTATMQQRIDDVTNSNLPWLVTEDNGAVVGYAYASMWKSRSAYRHSVEVSAYLLPTHTNRGLGKQLYKELFSILKSLNINTIIGGIALPNPASVALHESFGMEKVAHFKDVGYKFGKWVDVAYWQLILNA